VTDTKPRFSLTELADLAGVTPRTVRFYLSQGLLPSPGATGPGVKYGEDHLDRLRLIRRLQREHLPLAEIRSRLSGLDAEEIALLAEAVLPADDASVAAADPTDTALDYVRRLLQPPEGTASLLKRLPMVAEPPAPAYSSAPAVSSAPADASAPWVPAPPPIERSQWERVVLTPDIELHVRRPLSRPQSRKVDRLVSIARELLEEDPS
jgi:DNA-binding transcriptional MerR regulator